MPYTLHELACALRGIPRDARMLIRLPDGREVEIEIIAPRYAAIVGDAYAQAGRPYLVVLVAAET